MNDPIEALTKATVEHEASDLFLGEGEQARIKVNGKLWTAGEDILTREQLEAFWQTCGGDPESDQDHDASYEVEGIGRFRVNLHKQRGKLAAVLRLIKTKIPHLEGLGAPTDLLTNWLSKPAGLILVSGATGSGKSTTLAACLDWVNKHFAHHIVTIEDPIEYLFENEMAYFTQRAVGLDTEGFAKGLRGSLRQAPDIIFLGEIRDAETASVAIQAAETGHLVLSTVHSSGVTDAIERLTNIFPAEERDSALQLLSTQLLGVLSQKLLTGTDSKRLLVAEHFQNTGATRAWIRNTDLPAIGEFISRGDDPNNVNFMASLVRLCEEDQISAAEAEKASGNSTEFRRAFRGIS